VTPARWTEPAEREGWPTRRIESAELRYRAAVHSGWREGAAGASGAVLEQLFRGPSAADLLSVAFLEDADPDRAVAEWTTAVMALAGAPTPALLEDDRAPPAVLSWEASPVDGLAVSLDADDVHAAQGILLLEGPPRILSRAYALAARRERHAWRFVLAFESACPPGMPESLVEENDHVRAGATFGRLELL
jgi:hypothetical protein